jgi:hypothetical protein
MLPVWHDIEAKVKADRDAGTLVTTYDHPVVAQNLADAHVADQAAAMHAGAAAKTADPAAAKQHADAAAVASDVAAQKTNEAAAIQPTTISPQLTHEASQDAAQQPPPAGAPAGDHIAHEQAKSAHKHSPRGIILKEVDARFWAQTHYKVGQRLDPSNPTDAKMIPVWKDIYQKVKSEDRAGNLVITYNHPVVAQNLADAKVADQVAATQLDAAASASDPATAQQSVATAATASQIAAQKTREAAQLQPPSVSPPLAQDAAQKTSADSTVMKPGNLVSGRDHLAREQAKGAGRKAAGVHHDHRHLHRHRGPIRSTVHPGRVQDFRARAAHLAHKARAPFVLVIQHPDGKPERRTFQTRAELDAEYAKISEQHDQYTYVAAFDMTANPNAPIHDSVGVPAAEHADVPPPVPAAPDTSVPSAPPDTSAAPSTDPSPAPIEKTGMSTGKIVAIGIGVVVLGGIAFAATRKSPGPSRPSVLLATPTRTARVRGLGKF